MQWQLIPETTMHAFDINTLLAMIAINKLKDRTRADPEMTGNGHKIFFTNVKTINAAVKTHTRRSLRSQQLIFFGHRCLVYTGYFNNYFLWTFI
jgi:hypothetical protein